MYLRVVKVGAQNFGEKLLVYPLDGVVNEVVVVLLFWHFGTGLDLERRKMEITFEIISKQ